MSEEDLIDEFFEEGEEEIKHKEITDILREAFGVFISNLDKELRTAAYQGHDEVGITNILIHELNKFKSLLFEFPLTSDKKSIITLEIFMGDNRWEGGDDRKRGSGMDIGILIDYDLEWPTKFQNKKALGVQAKQVSTYDKKSITLKSSKRFIDALQNMEEFLGKGNSWLVVYPQQKSFGGSAIKIIKTDFLLRLKNKYKTYPKFHANLWYKSPSLRNFIIDYAIGCISGNSNDGPEKFENYLSEGSNRLASVLVHIKLKSKIVLNE